MYIFTTDTKKVYEITMRDWDGSGWGPDYYGEIADPQGTKLSNGVIAMTDAALDEEIQWWETEINNYDAGEPSWFTENDLDFEEGVIPDDAGNMCIEAEDVTDAWDVQELMDELYPSNAMKAEARTLRYDCYRKLPHYGADKKVLNSIPAAYLPAVVEYVTKTLALIDYNRVWHSVGVDTCYNRVADRIIQLDGDKATIYTSPEDLPFKGATYNSLCKLREKYYSGTAKGTD